MMAKIVKGSDFKGVVDYIIDKKNLYRGVEGRHADSSSTR